MSDETKDRSDYTWRDIGAPDALTFDPGHVVQFDEIKRRIAVFPLPAADTAGPGDATGYAAMDDICPHAGASLGDGWLDGDKIVCPLHGWEFDLRTGACPYGPEWSAESFELRTGDGGVLQVRIGRRSL